MPNSLGPKFQRINLGIVKKQLTFAENKLISNLVGHHRQDCDSSCIEIRFHLSSEDQLRFSPKRKRFFRKSFSNLAIQVPSFYLFKKIKKKSKL
jgi:hypothetical protein